MELQQSFSDYYGSIEPINKTENETISEHKGNYYIHHAIFSFHYNKTAISITSNPYGKVLLETCTFYNNSSTEDGGSFYILHPDCVLVHICLLLSKGKKTGCGYYIWSVQTTYKKSYAFECSFTECSGYRGSFYHYYGDIQVSNINTSFHKITCYAAYAISDPTGTGIIKFTTASNTSSTHYAVTFNNKCNVTKCNYLNNDYTGSDNGIIYSYRNSTNFSSCSFIGNKGNYLFDVKPNIVDNCYFNENNVTQTVRNDPISYDSNDSLDSFISHYSTEQCPTTNLEKNKKDSNLKFKKGKLKIKDIKNIVNKSFKTSFIVAVNMSIKKS
ncbi:hypothetical protein TVAG_183330 [Trichomonas vaginalis G3]|uniref:Right handed beta helix domain-containing protein n=1 Tax=Trichomonas vaginalis (strain ATCC PRA-98 / G3) TaxID=412133 RepID=A2D971_TRIV3|nr:hypothetical protein TVAGG3_0771360 [Trichomonas vaginalis G3]EAY23097.1 hypothetical protein TVAG_183330 [Trichomonas vaginalis G3]KAI5513847.1 hypothetical protein TVAGG3_0771360 [Trichomonas vaginalis G3]|eukprot:XP_001584083.1 hypothetical protein [Trichomonas vaginalis G3]